MRSCRQALMNMPLDSPLRPRCRDLETNCVDSNASDAQHDAAYLQFDIHASFVMEYLLTEFDGSLPFAGIRCLCYSRFDDILGEAESVTLLGGDDNVLEIAVYNWTHDGFCGTRYDAVLHDQVETPPSKNQSQHPDVSSDGVVPPPPQPHSEQRPLKRLRFKQGVEDRPAVPKDSPLGTDVGSLQSLHDVPSEDFYRMCTLSSMEVFFLIWAWLCLCVRSRLLVDIGTGTCTSLVNLSLYIFVYIYILVCRWSCFRQHP